MIKKRKNNLVASKIWKSKNSLVFFFNYVVGFSNFLCKLKFFLIVVLHFVNLIIPCSEYRKETEIYFFLNLSEQNSKRIRSKDLNELVCLFLAANRGPRGDQNRWYGLETRRMKYPWVCAHLLLIKN